MLPVPELGAKRTPFTLTEWNYDKNSAKQVPSEPGKEGDEAMKDHCH